MSVSLKQQYPLRLVVGQEDFTFQLDSGFTFSSVDPGGYEMASLVIPRDLPETLRGQYMRIDCGLEVAWEGRVKTVQRSLGEQTTITGEGAAAVLKDGAGSMVFVDRDLTRWSDPTLAREIAIATANFSLGDSEVGSDPVSNLPALAQTITDSWAAPYLPLCESWYDAGPLNLIAYFYFDLDTLNAYDGDVNWSQSLTVSSDTNISSSQGTGNISPATSDANYWTPSVQYRYALAQNLYTATPAGTDGATYAAYWRNLAVYGNHGLTPQGANPFGFYPSQIVQWLLGLLPGLQGGVMPVTDATGYIIPHSAYYDETGLDQIIGDMATIAGWTWGVWESRSSLTGNAKPRLDFRPRPPQGVYSASCVRADCKTCDIVEDLSSMYNRAVITFTSVDGTDQAVVVTADNPVLDQAQIQSRTVELNGGLMDPAAAAVFGAMALELLYTQQRVSGSLVIEGAINTMAGPTPAWLLKPGIDRIRVTDLPSTDAFGVYNDVPITRMECTGSTDGFSTSLDVGQGGSMVETLQARLTAASALAGQGS